MDFMIGIAKSYVMSRKIYLTFPIVIMTNYGLRIKDALNEVMEYCLYDKMIRYEENPSEAAIRMGITFHNIEKSIKKGKQLYDTIDGKAVKTSISKDMIFDFYENSKTDFEIITLIAFAAIRTIIQKQSCVKITNEYLLGRMSGNNKKGEIADFIKPYTSRYQLDKIKTELQLNCALKLFGLRMRGYYVSFILSLNSLAMVAAEKNRRYKQKRLRMMKQEAALAAQEQLKKRYEAVGINWSKIVDSRLPTNSHDLQKEHHRV